MAQESQTTACPQCGNSFPPTVKLCPHDGTVLEHDRTATTQIGTVLDGKYRLDAFLSQGGMGAVYRATHVMLNKKVAVKLINPELVTSSEIVRRFQREARAATTLSHPNIVSVYDLGQTAEGTLYIAMEFVDGPSLKSVIESGGPIPPMRTLTIMRQLASALSLAHKHGIIHRDLKPHNVMLARTEDGQQVAKLVDFGIAKTFDEGTQLTVAGFSPGTPQYMAPEQAEGRVVDARSDLYSLGIVLYEMLTGDVPFNATSTPSVLIKHIKEAPPPPSVKNPRVVIPPTLETITLRCLAKNPDERFQTADELGAALAHEAEALVASAASMQATLAVPGAPARLADAATLPMSAPPTAASTAPTAPTVKAQPPAPVMSSDTRPTAGAPPVSPALVADAAMAAAPKKGATNPVFVGVLVLMAIGAAALAYVNYAGGRPAAPVEPPASVAASPAKDAPAPPASPAMAPQAPVPQPSPTQVAGGESAGSTPAAAAASKADPVPSASVAAPAPAARPAAPKPSAPAATTGAGAVASAGRVAAPSSGQAPAASTPAAPAPAPAPATPQESTPASARVQQPTRPAAAFPEIPNVFFQCTGPQALCPAFRASVTDALEKAGMINVRGAARADIVIEATIAVLQERVDNQFGTTFAVRNYSIEVSGEVPRTSEVVPMPASTTVSFDPQFGAERGVEKARLVASDIADRVKAFVRRKRGG